MERRPGLRNVHHDRRGDIFTDTDSILAGSKNQDNAVSGDGQHDRTLSFDVCCALHDLR